MAGFLLRYKACLRCRDYLCRFLECSGFLPLHDHGLDAIQMLPRILIYYILYRSFCNRDYFTASEICDVKIFLILGSVAFLVTLLPNSSFHLWLGLTSDSQGHFKWAEPGLLSYTNWGPGEPVNNSGQNKNPV